MKGGSIFIYFFTVANAFQTLRLSSPPLLRQRQQVSTTTALIGRAESATKATTTTTTLAVATVEPPSIDTAVEVQPGQNQFQWFEQWYPVVPVEILDPEKPSKFTLLGMDVVVWNDGAVDSVSTFQSKKKRPKNAKRTLGQWRAFEDACPHRKVPLSDGRVEDDGTLLCSYHGWRFDGNGACTAIPQLTPEAETNGILWIWPSNDKDASLKSALSPPKTSAADDDDQDALWLGPWNYRELPYGADYFIENVVDPAHVTVSHHGIVGDRYDDQTQTFKLVEPLTKDGFKMQGSRPNANNDEKPATTEFKAPGLVDIVAPFGDKGAYQNLQLYVSPSRPGFCNHVGRMVIRKGSDGKFPSLLRMFTLPMPTWLNHLLASGFLNQDGLFLHFQERNLANTDQYKAYEKQEDGEPYNFNKAILPVESDVGVVNFRNWLRLLAGGRVPYKYNPTMPAPSSDVVFDVWNGHTKHCRYCMDALRRLKKARFASFLVSVALATLRPKLLGIFGNAAASFGFAGVGLALHKLIGMFHRYEFSHAEND